MSQTEREPKGGLDVMALDWNGTNCSAPLPNMNDIPGTSAAVNNVNEQRGYFDTVGDLWYTDDTTIKWATAKPQPVVMAELVVQTLGPEAPTLELEELMQAQVVWTLEPVAMEEWVAWMGPEGTDAGTGGTDAGTGGMDAGTGGDGGMGGMDAGTGGADAGTGGTDAGTGGTDAGTGGDGGAGGMDAGPKGTPLKGAPARRKLQIESCTDAEIHAKLSGPTTFTIGTKTFTVLNVLPNTTGGFTFKMPKFSRFDDGVETEIDQNEPDPTKSGGGPIWGNYRIGRNKSEELPISIGPQPEQEQKDRST
ncbi:MAG: hypothetical protein U0519_03640 [Candidatus Gracilibacteria bacterium]